MFIQTDEKGCVYLKEEWKDGKVVKICTIQHKGTTLMEIHKVSKSAIYLRTEKKIFNLFIYDNFNMNS
jgi:hypothetical protein